MKWEFIKINSIKHRQHYKTGVYASVFFGAINNKLDLLTVEMLKIC